MLGAVQGKTSSTSSMNKKVLIVAGVALAAAVATTVFFGVVLSDQLTPPTEPAEVVIAAAVRDLPRGTRLTPADVEFCCTRSSRGRLSPIRYSLPVNPAASRPRFP